MVQVFVRCYEELNEFISPELRYRTFVHTLQFRTTVKDLIEALGIPHTEIDLILKNGESVDFDSMVDDQDRVAYYPVFESIDISTVTKLRPQPLRKIRFVLDVHLGRLSQFLRFLGFDTLYRNDYDDKELAEISRVQKRILLTRDRGLLKRNAVTHGYYVRAIHPPQQIQEVFRRFDLMRVESKGRRCVKCNGQLVEVSKASIRSLISDRTAKYYERFHQCEDCEKIFWQGSHFHKLVPMLDDLVSNSTKKKCMRRGYSEDGR